jgi:hypothetical protein
VEILNRIVAAIAEHRFRYADEDELQRGLAVALCGHGYLVEREVRLDARNRIDLFVEERVAIEVKIAGTPDSVMRQVTRYAADDRVKAIVLVTSRTRHRLPPEINGKPVRVVSLAAAGL